MTKQVMRVPIASPRGHPGEIVLSDSYKAETIAVTLEISFSRWPTLRSRQ